MQRTYKIIFASLVMKCFALLILFLHAEINVSAQTVQSAGLKQPVSTYINWV